MIHLFRYIALTCMLTLLLATGGAAQSLLPSTSAEAAPAQTITGPLSDTEATALVSRLSDKEVREILLSQLSTKPETPEQTGDGGSAEFFYHASAGALSSITTPIQRLPILVTAQGRAFENFYADFGAAGLIQFTWMFVAIALFGLAVEFVFRWFTRQWLRFAPPDESDLSLRDTLGSLFKRLCVDVGAVIVFIVVTTLASEAFMPPNFQTYAELIGT